MKKISDVSLGLHLLEIELTNRCNNKDKCSICYQLERDKGVLIDMPLDLVKELILFANEEGVSSVVLTGGETSVYPYLETLLSWIAEENLSIRFIIQSNGNIKNIPFELLSKLGAVHLSYEYNNSPARKSSSKAILDLAEHYNKRGLYTYLFATVHRYSLDHLDDMVESAVTRGLDLGINIFVPNSNTDLSIPADQYKNVMQKIYSLYQDGKILRPTCPLYSLLKNEKTEGYIGNKGGCTAGIASIVIRPNGDVIPCPFFDLKIDNVYEKHLADIWISSPTLALIRERLGYENPCGGCEHLSFCGGCRARAYQKTGVVNAADPMCFK